MTAGAATALSPIIGESPAIREAMDLVERFAPSELPILIVGATGTGKELIAQHVHHRSGRPGSLVAINCAALPRDTAESLLFGHRRGAFTGASESRPGYFRLADGRTLFLDELLSLAVDCQAKFLRVLEGGEVWPLGENEPVLVDVRIVAAVQDEVVEDLEYGAFRQDLYGRAAGVVIRLPPLIERSEDVMLLARHFAGLRGQRLDRRAERVLLSYRWPGNVRELYRVVERASVLAGNGILSLDALARAIDLGAAAPVPPDSRTRPPPALEAESARDRLLQLMHDVEWDTALAAEREGIHRASIYRRLRRYGLKPPSTRARTSPRIVRANSQGRDANPRESAR